MFGYTAVLWVTIYLHVKGKRRVSARRTPAEPGPQPAHAAITRRRTASPEAMRAEVIAAAATERGWARPCSVHRELPRVQALGCHICCACFGEWACRRRRLGAGWRRYGSRQPGLANATWSFRDVAWWGEIDARSSICGNATKRKMKRLGQDVTNGLDANSACSQRVVRSPKVRHTESCRQERGFKIAS